MCISWTINCLVLCIYPFLQGILVAVPIRVLMAHFDITDFLNKYYCLLLPRQPLVGQGLLIHEVFKSQTQRRTTVGRTSLDE